jgi:hypothetical protein
MAATATRSRKTFDEQKQKSKPVFEGGHGKRKLCDETKTFEKTD